MSKCPECGADAGPAASPEGYCPKCLLKLAMPDSGAQSPAPPDDATTRLPASSSSERIGSYRVLHKLGEGGMGVVYEAEQEHPIRRKVALKLIKAGMDSQQVVTRFESERQALALMSHPNIARVFDAGVTDQGRPFFAMEFVPGVPITEYCDTHRLPTRERLELFRQVCAGVQHAHHKGIIHRDIKPSNVLVTLQDGHPMPKIIDFGVAKATQHRLTERTVFTQMGVLIGTPEYMSPEQAELTALDIDTRTDVYSLGVLLYELLAGALPFDPRELREAAFDEIRRRIREEEPSKPSTRVSTLGDPSAESARRRSTDPASLARELRGDLDWITMKALEKDPTRRYDSPYEFAEDIRRYLCHEPVVAGPPGAAYQARKFIRRHRAGVAFATVLALVLVVFAATMAIQAARIARERDRANEEAATAEQVSDFLVDLFEVSDPVMARGDSVTAREILEAGAEKIERELTDQPVVRARMLDTVGNVYWKLGLLDEAGPLLEEALAIRRETLDEHHPQTLDTLDSLAGLHYRQGHFDEAERLYLEVLDLRRRVLGEEHPATLDSKAGLADVYWRQGRLDEAESLHLEALEARRRLGIDQEGTLSSMNRLATVYERQGRYEEAEPLHLEALEARRRLLGDDHPDTLVSINNLATLYLNQSRYAEAEPLFRECVATSTRVLGRDHSHTFMFMNGLALLYNYMGRYDDAEPLYRESLEAARRMLGTDHPKTVTCMNNFALMYANQGRYDDAEPLYLEALEVKRRVLPADHPSTLNGMNNLAVLYGKQGRYEEAEALHTEVLVTRRRVLGEEHPSTLLSMSNLGDLYVTLGRYREANALLEAAVEGSTRVLSRTHVETGKVLGRYGQCLAALKRYEEAETALLEAHEILSAALGSDHTRTRKTAQHLVDLYDTWGKPDRATPWREKALEP